MDSPVDFDVWGTNRSVLELNRYTTQADNLIIKVKACVEPVMEKLIRQKWRTICHDIYKQPSLGLNLEYPFLDW